MSDSPLASELIALAAARFGREDAAARIGIDDDFFQALGIDSLQALDLLTEVEDRYDVEIPDYELQGVTTFRALAELIEVRR